MTKSHVSRFKAYFDDDLDEKEIWPQEETFQEKAIKDVKDKLEKDDSLEPVKDHLMDTKTIVKMERSENKTQSVIRQPDYINDIIKIIDSRNKDTDQVNNELHIQPLQEEKHPKVEIIKSIKKPNPTQITSAKEERKERKIFIPEIRYTGNKAQQERFVSDEIPGPSKIDIKAENERRNRSSMGSSDLLGVKNEE